jgi:hypothetical protein
VRYEPKVDYLKTKKDSISSEIRAEAKETADYLKTKKDSI